MMTRPGSQRSFIGPQTDQMKVRSSAICAPAVKLRTHCLGEQDPAAALVVRPGALS